MMDEEETRACAFCGQVKPITDFAFALGLAHEDPNRLRALAGYIEKHATVSSEMAG